MPIRPVEIMEKHTYDPDKDGIIALAQLVAEVCNNTDTDTKVAAEAAARIVDVDAEEADRIADVNAEETARINALTTHTELPAAHHAKTIDASELTAGILALARLAGITNTQIAAGAAIVYTKLALTGAIKAADIEAAAGIPLSKLESAVCSETEADNKITTHKGDASAHHTAYTDAAVLAYLEEGGLVAAVLATVADFQTNPATGTAPNPERINDNNTASWDTVDTLLEYEEVDFGKVVIIKRWRQYGSVEHDGSGRFTIQYWDLVAGAWADWSTDIATRTLASWSELITETIVYTTKVKIIHTTLDAGPFTDANLVYEMEIID